MDRSELGIDIELSHSLPLGSALHLKRVRGDFETVEGMDNLKQALWMRLGVPMGDLAHLGHPDFGSRLHLLIGRLASPETIALAKAYVRESLRREGRIEEVENISVHADPLSLGVLLIEIAVRPRSKPDLLRLTMSFALDPGQTEAIPHAAARR